jgi:hypothetical protein
MPLLPTFSFRQTKEEQEQRIKRRSLSRSLVTSWLTSSNSNRMTATSKMRDSIFEASPLRTSHEYVQEHSHKKRPEDQQEDGPAASIPIQITDKGRNSSVRKPDSATGLCDIRSIRSTPDRMYTPNDACTCTPASDEHGPLLDLYLGKGSPSTEEKLQILRAREVSKEKAKAVEQKNQIRIQSHVESQILNYKCRYASLPPVSTYMLGIANTEQVPVMILKQAYNITWNAAKRKLQDLPESHFPPTEQTDETPCVALPGMEHWLLKFKNRTSASQESLKSARDKPTIDVKAVTRIMEPNIKSNWKLPNDSSLLSSRNSILARKAWLRRSEDIVKNGGFQKH